ncbi:hypothetical protein [Nonomuraea sp. NPDC049695]|uniref:hypothetical protein n=1 Tax=Nonomuraea sp. NPDC049695 TaxID=3154734 RepID=UPI00342B2278
MDRRKAGLAAGMVAVLVLGGSGARAATPSQGVTDDPCAKAATCSPSDIAKMKEEEAAKAEAARTRGADPGKDGSTCSADVKQPASIDSGKLAQALADTLGVGLDRAAAAVQELDLLSQKGGMKPDSPEFAAVAERLGVPADRLNQALRAIKQAFAPPRDGTPDGIARPDLKTPDPKAPDRFETPDPKAPDRFGTPEPAKTPGS